MEDSNSVTIGQLARSLITGEASNSIDVSLTTQIAESASRRSKEFQADFALKFATGAATLPSELQARVRTHLLTEAGSRFFEQAWRQSANCLDEAKRDHLAKLVVNSLRLDQLHEQHARWLLQMLEALDVVQIAILKSLSRQYQEDATFLAANASLMSDSRPPIYPTFTPSFEASVDLWSPAQNQAEYAVQQKEFALFQSEREAFEAGLPPLIEAFEAARERHVIYRHRRQRLVEMGLLATVPIRGASFKPGALSETLTPVAVAFLKAIGAVDESEPAQGEQVTTLEWVQQIVAGQDSVLKVLSQTQTYNRYRAE